MLLLLFWLHGLPGLFLGRRFGGASLQSDLDEAIKRHRAGDLDAAERLYEGVLKHAPAQPDALNLLAEHPRRRDEDVASCGPVPLLLHTEAGLAGASCSSIMVAETVVNVKVNVIYPFDHIRRLPGRGTEMLESSSREQSTFASTGDSDDARSPTRSRVGISQGATEDLAGRGLRELVANLHHRSG